MALPVSPFVALDRPMLRLRCLHTLRSPGSPLPFRFSILLAPFFFARLCTYVYTHIHTDTYTCVPHRPSLFPACFLSLSLSRALQQRRTVNGEWRTANGQTRTLPLLVSGRGGGRKRKSQKQNKKKSRVCRFGRKSPIYILLGRAGKTLPQVHTLFALPPSLPLTPSLPHSLFPCSVHSAAGEQPARAEDAPSTW